MLKSFALSAVLILAAGAVAGAAGPELKTDDQKTLYALGLVISQNLASFNLSPSDLDSVLAGVSDGVLKKESKVDVQTYAPKIQQLQASRAGASAAVEKKAGQVFLDKAAAEKGATRTASGLIITTLKPGTGPSPKATDKVKVHYHGTLTDGTVFDSSVQRGEPIDAAAERRDPMLDRGRAAHEGRRQEQARVPVGHRVRRPGPAAADQAAARRSSSRSSCSRSASSSPLITAPRPAGSGPTTRGAAYSLAARGVRTARCRPGARPRLDAAPQHLVARRQRSTVRHREPEPIEESIAARSLVVLEGRPRVVGHVVVQELDVARSKLHLEAQLFGDLRQQIERLVLRRGDAAGSRGCAGPPRRTCASTGS